MKNKIFSIVLAGLAAMSFTSCEDYFDDVPNNATSLKDVFSNRGQTLNWLTNVYSYIPDNTARYASGTAMFWGPATIEGYLPWDWVETHHIIQGSLYPSTGFVSRIWTEYYRGIQYANIYLANVDKCEPMNSTDKEWTKAECRALRAFFYFNLMKLYGPVPIVGDRIYKVDDDLDQLPRSTVDECFDYIITELRSTIDGGHLVSQFEGGRYNPQMMGNFTSEAVEAILAEVYLFRASYLFNGNPFYQSLANADGKKLFPQERDEQKWIDARDAAKRIIDSGKYSLVYRNLSGQLSTLANSVPFQSVFAASFANEGNEELIYGRTSSSNETYSMVPRFEGLGSNQNKGGGAYTVPLEFIDLYFTKNGLSIEKDPTYFTYDVNNPPDLPARNPKAIVQARACVDPLTNYQYFSPVTGNYAGPTSVMKQFYDREPRFYLAITFQNRPWDFHNNVAVQMQYNGNSGSNGNTHDYPIFGTITRKLYYAKAGSWPMSMMYRLAEIYLNYAEACAELGDFGEAIHYVNLIRQRAGIPEYKGPAAADQSAFDAWNQPRIDLGTLTKELVLKVIYRERILELSYESKHYFDVRRWDVADGTWRGGEEMTDGWIYPSYHKGGEGGEMHGFNVDNKDVTEENKNVNFYKRVVQQHRTYQRRMMLLPIPQGEINRDRNMVQNTGWIN